MSKIPWTQRTWNPITGCSPASPGCAHCYAAAMARRLAGRCGYPKDNPFAVTLHSEGKLREPFGWKKPQLIFVCSMGDLFHQDVPDSWLDRVFAVMAATPRHTYQVLTKRPERMLRYMTRQGMPGRLQDAYLAAGLDRLWFEYNAPAWPLPNVWLGTTCEDQARADERIPILLQCPAVVRFVSVEPMLTGVDLEPYIADPDGGRCYRCKCGWHRTELDIHLMKCGKIAQCQHCGERCEIFPALSWVICGGETGPGARPMHPDWVRSLRDQCRKADVPFFFKQWAKYRGPGDFNYPLGNMVDGRIWEQFPTCSGSGNDKQGGAHQVVMGTK